MPTQNPTPPTNPPLFNIPNNNTPKDISNQHPFATPHYDPMELDNSEAGKAARKAYRWANNLCGYCGKPGHKIVNCPTLANRGSRPRPEISNSEVLDSNVSNHILYEQKN